MMPWCTLADKYLFELLFSSLFCLYLGVDLLDHTVILFWGTASYTLSRWGVQPHGGLPCGCESMNS